MGRLALKTATDHDARDTLCVHSAALPSLLLSKRTNELKAVSLENDVVRGHFCDTSAPTGKKSWSLEMCYRPESHEIKTEELRRISRKKFGFVTSVGLVAELERAALPGPIDMQCVSRVQYPGLKIAALGIRVLRVVFCVLVFGLEVYLNASEDQQTEKQTSHA